MLALYVRKLDGSKRFGPRTYPHVEISSKFEVLGPRNGRGPTSSKPLKVKVPLEDGTVDGGSLSDTLRPPRAPALFRETADHTRMHTRRHEETVTARRARLSYTARSDVVAREAGRCELLLLMWWHLVHAVPRNVRIRSRFCMRCRFSIDHDS